jgi:hypothetical protein
VYRGFGNLAQCVHRGDEGLSVVPFRKRISFPLDRAVNSAGALYVGSTARRAWLRVRHRRLLGSYQGGHLGEDGNVELCPRRFAALRWWRNTRDRRWWTSGSTGECTKPQCPRRDELELK